MLHRFLIELEKIFNASPILGLGASFLAGLLVSCSPCIMPLIPITLSIVGATSASSRLKGFFISLIFVLGVATTYTILGVVASFFGIFLGKIFDNVIAYSILALLFFLFGLYLTGRNLAIIISLATIIVGAFYTNFSNFRYVALITSFLILGFILSRTIKLNFLSFSHNYSPKATALSIFILGLLSGLAIIPCNFPVLGAILGVISLKKDLLYGALALFLFSLGYGIILIALGTFTSLINKLPKQSFLLVVIRKFLGIVLILTGIYFLFKFILLIR
jgi:thiol:disulfide interchange protein DsbD